MTPQQKKLSRRAALAGFGGLVAGAQLEGVPGVGQAPAARAAEPRRLQDVVPIRGKAGPGLEPFDDAMLKIMDRHGIPGAALAIAKEGRLVLAKGYGWSNVTTGDPVEPDTLFGLASLSKTFTAVAILHLVEKGKLGLDDRVFDHLKHLPPPRGAEVDPRLHTITVRQCLNHSGGWNRTVTGDPINWEPVICRAYRSPPPASSRQFVSFMQGVPLNFKPGTEEVYSNVGYVMLGEVIAKVSGQAYDRYVVDNVFKPMGVTGIQLHPRDGRYLPNEAHRHLAGTLVTLPPMNVPMLDAAGGWSASVVSLLRFLTNLDGSRGKSVVSEKSRTVMLARPPEPLKPRENGSYFGLGWDAVLEKDTAFTYFKDGSYQGMRTFMKRLPTGVNWALLYNASMDFDPHDREIAANTVHEVRQLVEGIGKHPDLDLFKEYP